MSAQGNEEPLAFERIVFFSDAVFAIAITLLVLEIKVPHLPEDARAAETIDALARLIPKAIGYVVSFIVLGSFWIEHHRIFRFITRFDGGLLWRNLFMLLAVAFVPFPTALFSENYTNPVALAVYVFTLAAVGLSKIWLWAYAAQDRRLLPAALDDAVVRTISRRSWAVPLTALAVAGLATLGFGRAYAGFALIPAVAWALGKGVSNGAAVTALLLALAPACAPGPVAHAPVAPIFLPAPDSALRTLPFSEAVQVGDLFFLSGQIGAAPGALTLVPGGLEPEAVQTMENIKALLTRHGLSLDRVVKCTVFLADMRDWPAFNAIYRRYFSGHYPARSALGANGLALGAKVEVECIASR